MQWFRFYHEALDDPKVQQLPATLFKHWVNLLCLANQQTPRGTLPPLRDIAFRLRLGEAHALKILDELASIGLIDRDGETLLPHNWKQRQRESDDVAKRVAKHRSNVTGNVTSSLDVTPPDTDTETELPPLSPEGGNGPDYTDEFEAWFAQYPKGRGSKAKAFALWRKLSVRDRQAAVDAMPLFRAGRDWREGFHSGPEVWLRGRCWENPPESMEMGGSGKPLAHNDARRYRDPNSKEIFVG